MKHFFWLLWLLPSLVVAQEFSKPSPYDSAHFSWRKPVPRDRLRELQPDRPGVTESPFTVDAGHLQIEVDGLRLVNSGTGREARERELRVAYTNLKLGLSRRTDLQLEVPVYKVTKQRPADASEWQERHSGFGDVTVRLKHNFLGDDRNHRVAVAAIGFVRLPSGGLAGGGGTEYGLVLPLNVALSDKVSLEAQLQTDLSYDREEARRFVGFIPSLALGYDFTEKLGLITEAVAQWNTQQRRWQTSFNIAPLIKVTENLQLDAGTHLALDRLSDREYFVGFTLRR
ncbi:transporter [Hymenobacter glacialis]|nr:transporter [Hymenobacter glacialis]